MWTRAIAGPVRMADGVTGRSRAGTPVSAEITGEDRIALRTRVSVKINDFPQGVDAKALNPPKTEFVFGLHTFCSPLCFREHSFLQTPKTYMVLFSCRRCMPWAETLWERRRVRDPSEQTIQLQVSTRLDGSALSGVRWVCSIESWITIQDGPGLTFWPPNPTQTSTCFLVCCLTFLKYIIRKMWRSFATTTVYDSTSQDVHVASLVSVPILDPCLSNPCRRGGTCTRQRSGSYTCVCPPYYGGINCTDVQSESYFPQRFLWYPHLIKTDIIKRTWMWFSSSNWFDHNHGQCKLPGQGLEKTHGFCGGHSRRDGNWVRIQPGKRRRFYTVPIIRI